MDAGNPTARWSAYLLLIALAVGNMVGRIMAVDSVDVRRLERYRIDQRMKDFRVSIADRDMTDQERDDLLQRKRDEVAAKLQLSRPFLSSNDRSRWMAARALVEQGKFEIDEIREEPNWDSIDIVRHPGGDGEQHFYSSKPPLTYLHMAAAYWLVNRTTGMSLADEPHATGRVLVVLLNVLPMIVMFAVVARIVERLGTTDFGRMFAMATICLGTLLTTFAVVANNHIWAAVAASLALWSFVELRSAERPTAWLFVIGGLSAALTAALELPALSFLVFLGLVFLLHWPKQTLICFLPAAVIVGGGYLAANKIAHDSWRPPYMHRSETDPDDNWYAWEYVDSRGVTRQSYWINPQGIDRGEQSRADYALHCLVGHHGVFSLTPVWALTLLGSLVWLARGNLLARELAALALALGIICLTFYIGFRPLEDRNYGGMTSGFRWMFWFAPLWTITLLPAADKLSCCRAGQAFAATLLAFSAMSVSYPTWNPWVQPWIWNWLEWWGMK